MQNTSYYIDAGSDSFHFSAECEDKSLRKKLDDYLAACKARGRQKKERKGSGQYTKSDPLIKFLRERISRLNYGVKAPEIGVRPELSMEKFVARYNDRRFGASLKNDQFLDHFASRQTYYFWADHRSATEESIFMIDIDAEGEHGGGSMEGAWKFAEIIKDRVPCLKGMFTEQSTHLKGVHGYPVLLKAGIHHDEVRRILKQLDAYLKKLAASVGADIACVEVKGLPPSVKYDDHGNITHITFGQWAKLPRGRGVLDTCKVKFGDLALLDPDEIKGEPQPKATKTESVNVGSKRPSGSFDYRVVRQETLDKMPELEQYAEKLLRQWTGASSFKAGRWAVTSTDVAQFFALMLCIKPKPDDSLPLRAIGRLWEEVYLAGDFSRAWNHHRCKAIRDLLSQHGHIDWIDFRFQNLPQRKGRCCRWQISLMLRSLLASLMGEATVVDTADRLEDGPHEFHTPRWFNFTLDRQLRWWAEAEQQVEMLFAA